MNTVQYASTVVSSHLEEYFKPFRQNTIGYHQTFDTPYGSKRIIYADWTASGRMYATIEDKLRNEIAPFVGNTHTETTVTGKSMTLAYHKAQKMIKQFVNAGENDVLLTSGSGMTSAVNRLQRILGLRIPEKWNGTIHISKQDRPIIFVTHMEHHSNHTSWLETICDVERIEPTENGEVDLEHLAILLRKHHKRQTKIAAITAASNVTGVQPPYHQIAKMMHENAGLCFVDFACAAPYVKIDMHPAEPLEKLDAIFFSPHKFLGGPATPGILVFDSKLYQNTVPDRPGGGTVSWTNPWGEHRFIEDIEAREDGGTPAFLQTIKAALCMKLKEEMNVEKMQGREEELMHILFNGLKNIAGLHILAEHLTERLGIVSFYIENMHYNLGVKLLNDRFGIQVRGGCSCAGTYGHHLLQITKKVSNSITCEIDEGNLSHKPGWLRASIHPIMTNEDAELLVEGIRALAANHKVWAADYIYCETSNEFVHKNEGIDQKERVNSWFENIVA